MIIFDEGLHKYIDLKGQEYISATTLIGKYKNKFEKLEEAEKYVKNHPEFPMTVEQCLYAWDFLCDFALEKGNYYHDKKELEYLYKSSVVEKGYNDDINFKLSDLKTGIYPELRIYNPKIKLAGHADRVEIEEADLPKPFKGYADIEDYKTYKDSMTKVSFRNKKLKYPLNNIPDSNYYHAGLQLNIYAFMLKCYGYLPRKLTIHHKPFDDRKPIPEDQLHPFKSEEEQRKPKIYEIKYNEEIVLRLINHYLKNEHQRRN